MTENDIQREIIDYLKYEDDDGRLYYGGVR